MSRSGYYAWAERAPSQRSVDDIELVERIRQKHKESYQTYGYRRIHADLRDDGIQVGARRVRRLMRENGICGITRKLRRRIRQLAEGGRFFRNAARHTLLFIALLTRQGNCIHDLLRIRINFPARQKAIIDPSRGLGL